MSEVPKKADDLNMMLLTAAGESNVEEVKRLLECGADGGFIHAPAGVWGSCDVKGPLHMAILARRTKRAEDEEAAAKSLVEWKELLKVLIDAGANVNAKRKDYDWRGCGTTASAFEMVLPYALQDPDLLEMFLNAGADANTMNRRDVHSMRTDGRSVEYVLHQVVRGGNLEVARALLDCGADVDAVASERFHNERGYNRHTEETALHRACCDRHDIAMCALLLARGANVNALRKDLDIEEVDVDSPTDDPRDSDYICPVRCIPVVETALHRAILAKRADLVTMLVCAGADVSTQRTRGDTMTSCEDLCEGDEALLQALKAEWTPETHKHFPAEVRTSVETALMIARRQQWPLPDTVLFRVCALAASP